MYACIICCESHQNESQPFVLSIYSSKLNNFPLTPIRRATPYTSNPVFRTHLSRCYYFISHSDYVLESKQPFHSYTSGNWMKHEIDEKRKKEKIASYLVILIPTINTLVELPVSSIQIFTILAKSPICVFTDFFVIFVIKIRSFFARHLPGLIINRCKNRLFIPNSKSILENRQRKQELISSRRRQITSRPFIHHISVMRFGMHLIKIHRGRSALFT